ncbi:hypothetical protein RGQ29_010609 [Quercus rubra]|uniref:TF-B3 domain-containing protein n=1 Tax=Quercus rubra TaxID=3512 RepID=A0AAN7FYR8_QUERU|nr:hypothetical protein RGQ29_010609 [Quercus rubra]
MNFGAHREGFCEEAEHMVMMRGKLPFSYSSSSSHDASDVKQQLELMESSPRNEDDLDEVRQNELAPTGAVTGSGSTSGTSSSTGMMMMMMEKEHMFDKVVTPSDVGKLNRLVIPKQHAEKYFPLDSSTNEKGLLLNFEDRNGKPWRFRYSYWNSSQSYVMTKGWSRFVKEKKLDAGDIVSFQRGVGELGKDRLFIDWRRRPDAPDPNLSLPLPLHHHHHFSSYHHQAWSPLLMRPPPRDRVHIPHHLSYNNNNNLNLNLHHHPHPHPYRNTTTYCNVVNPYGSGSLIYLRSAATLSQQQHHQQQQQQQQHQQQQLVQMRSGVETPMVFESVPVVQGKVAAKKLRLFGVNMECPISETDECDILASTTIAHTSMPSQPSTLLSSSSQSPLQLRLYNGTPLPTVPTDFLNKGKASMSFDFDI